MNATFEDVSPVEAEELEIASSINLHEDTFLVFNKSESNPTVMELLTYQKQAILSVLNLKREDDLEVRTANQIQQLLNISKYIIQKTCAQLVRPEFFNMVMET